MKPEACQMREHIDIKEKTARLNANIGKFFRAVFG